MRVTGYQRSAQSGDVNRDSPLLPVRVVMVKAAGLLHASPLDTGAAIEIIKNC